MSDKQDVRFNVDRIVDGSTRTAVIRLLESELHWSKTKTGRKGTYLPTIIIGNAARLVEMPVSERRFEAPVGVMALIGSADDRDAASVLIEICAASRLTMTLDFVERSARRTPRRLIENAERLAWRLAPERIRSATFADGVLLVVFGDGQAHAFEWGRTSILKKLVDARPETATVSEDFDAVVVLDSKGRDIDIDGLVLRRLVDNQVAAESASEFSLARNRIGARLRKHRETRKLSQEELARRSGLPQETISRLESGSRTPRLETLSKLASGLGVPLERLLRAIDVSRD